MNLDREYSELTKHIIDFTLRLARGQMDDDETDDCIKSLNLKTIDVAVKAAKSKRPDICKFLGVLGDVDCQQLIEMKQRIEANKVDKPLFGISVRNFPKRGHCFCVARAPILRSVGTNFVEA